MQRTYGQSATKRRLDVQRGKLDALESDATIDAVEPTHDELGRVKVRIGKTRFGPIHPDDVDALALAVGQSLDASIREQLFEAIAREAARSDALRLLAARSRAKGDLIGRLRARGHEPQHAGEAADRLEAVGLLDDRTLAFDKAASLVRAKKLGPRAAKAKLLSLGFASNLADEAIEHAFGQLDLTEQATEAALRRLASMSSSLERSTCVRRLYAFLARRGYDHATCKHAVDKAMADEYDEHRSNAALES